MPKIMEAEYDYYHDDGTGKDYDLNKNICTITIEA